MNTAFVSAVDALFGDPHLARDIVYTADGGAPALVRAILRRPDEVTGFGETRLWSETTRLDLRASEVQNPRPGDTIEVDGQMLVVQGEPVRDPERLIWTLDVRPQ